LYNIIGQKVRAGTVRRGVYFAGLQPLGFRKVLLVR
jgi:hypothetical protein